VLVLDGRVDNRESIDRALKAHGMYPRTNTDAELVLGAYQLWGEESPVHLLGDFVYAVWDDRRRRLFCARDHMGARPLYYTRNSQIFAFASEDEALLGLPGVSKQPNEELIAHLLVPSFISFEDDARSWLWDVSALLPARYLTASSGGAFRIETYWKLEPGEESVYASDRECEEAFLAVFGEAVRCRMRSTGPVAAMMSGGMDSASIMAMVKRLLPEMPGKEFHTYSAIADDPSTCLESQCIQSLTRDLGNRAHFVSVPSFRGMVGLDDLIEMAWPKAHPVDNSILLPAMMCLAAGRDNHRVLLHGVSGDLTTHVPDRLAAFLMRNGAWLWAWQECLGASRNHTFLRRSSPLLLWLLNFWSAYVPVNIKRLVWWVRRRGSNLSKSIINPSFASKLKLADRLLHMQEAAFQQPNLENIGQIHAKVLNSPTFGIVLGLTGYEHMAGRYGVELRDPWSDKRLIEFFLRLPIRHKMRNGWTKYLIRTSFASDLEPIIRTRRSKEHLGWRFAERLMVETQEFVSYTIKHSLNMIASYVDPKVVYERYNCYKSSQNDVEREFFYDILTLILWLQRISNVT
jgi:asparagine synthase (glutamine-hydrolysing)